MNRRQSIASYDYSFDEDKSISTSYHSKFQRTDSSIFHSFVKPQNSRRCAGKIVKNQSTLKTDYDTQYKRPQSRSSQKSSLIKKNGNLDRKRRASIAQYQNKFTSYEIKKQEVVKDLQQLSHQDKKYGRKRQNILMQTDKLNETKKKYQYEHKSQANQNIEPITRVISDKREEEEKVRFVKEIDCQIQLENNLRKLKMQINSRNRKEIKDLIRQSYSIYEYDHEQIMNVSFQEYEWDSNERKDGIQSYSPKILAEKLIQAFQACQNNWNKRIEKKFSKETVKIFYESMKFERKVGLDLKSFTRQFNIYFSRNYQAKQMYRVYAKIAPLTKNNFLQHFSS